MKNKDMENIAIIMLALLSMAVGGLIGHHTATAAAQKAAVANGAGRMVDVDGETVFGWNKGCGCNR